MIGRIRALPERIRLAVAMWWTRRRLEKLYKQYTKETWPTTSGVGSYVARLHAKMGAGELD